MRQEIDGFLAEFPVKLGAIADRLGVKVLLSTLPRGTSGQIGQEDGDFVIRINRHEAKHRQRFTLAHELAHFLLHRDRIVDEGGWSENDRSRVMGARYPYYLLADSADGQRKEAEITRTPPKSASTYGSIRQGFVYDRVPHITLKFIASNAEIDVNWDRL